MDRNKRTVVDPFVPVGRRSSRAGESRRHMPALHAHDTAVPAVTTTATPKASASSSPQKKEGRVKSAAQTAALVFVALVVGLFMPIQIFGYIVIGIYGIIAILLKIKSRLTFILACLSLVFVAGLSAFGVARSLMTTFATYAFLLLVVATVTLLIEMRGSHDERPKGPGLRIPGND